MDNLIRNGGLLSSQYEVNMGCSTEEGREGGRERGGREGTRERGNKIYSDHRRKYKGLNYS